MVESQFRTTLKFVPIDRFWVGVEFQKTHNFFSNLGIVYHISCPYTHEQNGIIVRRHNHKVEIGLLLLPYSGVP